MKAAMSKKETIRIAVVESDPLRFIVLKSLFDTEPDLETLIHSVMYTESEFQSVRQ